MDPQEQLALAKAQPAEDTAWVSPFWLVGSQIGHLDRANLVEWMAEVQDYLDLSDMTLHLGVANLDRVLAQIDFDADEFQLLGLASLLVAAKTEEDIVPSMENLLKMAGGVFSRKDLARVEREVLMTLNFRIRKNTAAVWLHLYKENIPSGRKLVFRLAKAILDLSLTQEWHGTVTPSKMASCCLMAASCLLGKGWPDDLAKVTGYPTGQLTYFMTACLRVVEDPTLCEGVREKHSKILAKVERKVRPEAVETVVRTYIAVHVRVHRDSLRG